MFQISEENLTPIVNALVNYYCRKGCVSIIFHGSFFNIRLKVGIIGIIPRALIVQIMLARKKLQSAVAKGPSSCYNRKGCTLD